MLGHVVLNRFLSLEKYHVYDISSSRQMSPNTIICDVKNINRVEEIITEINPDYIINCIGVLISESIKNPSNAIFINAYFPHKLKEYSDKINAKLIHISTDCVFDGTKGNYSEEDKKTAQDTYGMSKSLGEIINNKDLTLRTSIIGPEIKENGEGLLHWLLNQNGEINGYSKSIWGGVTTLKLAEIIELAIKNDFTGLIHVTNGVKISKYDLLNLIIDVFNLEHINVLKTEGKISDKSLSTTRNELKEKVPSYREMIEELFFYIRNNDIYKYSFWKYF